MQEDPVINAPIRSLQRMLRAIAFASGAEVAVIPDGIYGDSTEKAVSQFQKEQGLPVTGTADDKTFRAIVRAYNLAFPLLSQTQSGVVWFPAQLVIYPGQSHPHVGLAQSMFVSLGQKYSSFSAAPVSGTLDSRTSDNLRHLQHYAGLPETGTMDKHTWNRLNMLYRTLFDRNCTPTQG